MHCLPLQSYQYYFNNGTLNKGTPRFNELHCCSESDSSVMDSSSLRWGRLHLLCSTPIIVELNSELTVNLSNTKGRAVKKQSKCQPCPAKEKRYLSKSGLLCAEMSEHSEPEVADPGLGSAPPPEYSHWLSLTL